jgi:hypothetical protein
VAQLAAAGSYFKASDLPPWRLISALFENGLALEVLMKMTQRFVAKLVLSLAACSAMLATSYCRAMAVQASPTPAAATMPTLLLQGTGRIVPTGACTSTSCPGTLTATLTGVPVATVNLTLNLEVNLTADEFTGCHEVTGSGEINQGGVTINLTGQLCTPGVGYTLSGTAQIYGPANSTGNSRASVGTLLAFGGTHTPPNPVPRSGRSLVNLIGSSGSIPLFLP